MTWVLLAIAAWVLLSLPIAVVIGHVIREDEDES